jgi:hypothetical protein
MARPRNPRYDTSGIEARTEELKSTLSSDIEGLPLELLAVNLREMATLEAMMEGCKEVLHTDGLTRQEMTGAKNNRHVKVVANANLDTYLKLLRAYNSVTASITRLAKPAAAAAEEEGLDEFDAFNA